jgi:protein TonB
LEVEHTLRNETSRMTTVGHADTDPNPAPAQAAHAPVPRSVSALVRELTPAAAAESATALSNVVPFRRKPRTRVRSSAPALKLDPSERPALPPAAESWLRGATFFVLSLTAHAALFAAFNPQPSPKASIGMEVITVELVLGANTNAGLAPTPSPSEEAKNSAAAEAGSEEPPLKEDKPQDVRQETQPESQEDKQPDTEADAAKPQVVEESLQPSVKEPEITPEPARQKAADPKPTQTAPAAKPEPRKKRPTPAPVNAAPSQSSSGIGRGRSDTDTNYRGLVAAHLQRYKQFPPDARRLGNQGSAMVSFRLDGSGRVVSVKLVRAIGVESLDREVVAMVHRASPFPAPPDGRPAGFSVPLDFRIANR